jgi:hypothetical protein
VASRIFRKKAVLKKLAQIEQEIHNFVQQLKAFDAGNGYVGGTHVYVDLLDCEGFRPLVLEEKGQPVNRDEIEQGIHIAIEDCLKDSLRVLHEEINSLEEYIHNRDVQSYVLEKELMIEIYEEEAKWSAKSEIEQLKIIKAAEEVKAVKEGRKKSR